MKTLPFELTFTSYKTLPVNTPRPNFRYNHWLSIKNNEHEGKMGDWEISHVLRLNPNRWSVRTFVYVTSQNAQQACCIIVDGKDSIHRIDTIDIADLSLAMTARDANHLGIEACPISLTGDAEQYGYEPVHGDKDKLMLIDRDARMRATFKDGEVLIDKIVDRGLVWTTPQINTPPDDDNPPGRNTQFSN